MNDMLKPERVKTRVTFSLTATLTFDDDGYLGAGASVEEHLKHARELLNACQFLVKQGGTEPKPVQTKVELHALTLIPKGD
jgi:hypothetical protein